MSQSQTSKTTIEVDAKLLYQAKLKALKESKTLKEVIEDSLILHLHTHDPRPQELNSLANELVGSLKNTKNPHWRTQKSITTWLNGLRNEWL